MKFSNEMMYDMIVDTLQLKIDNNELTLEQAEKINDLAFNKYISEGTLSRVLAKSNKGKKADTVLRCWANSIDILPSKEKAEEYIKKIESIPDDKIKVDHSIDKKFLVSCAVVGYPQNKFIKIISKIDNGEYPKWMLNVSNSSNNKMYEKALNEWKKGKYKVICGDGFGNSLVYSINKGKFYDFFHEEDTSDNYKSWLSEGISYKDFMNHILNKK